MSFVTCKLYGRMGNQMFMIACVMGIAWKQQWEFLIPNYTGDPGRPADHLYFDHFPVFNPNEHHIKTRIKEETHNFHRIKLFTDMQIDGYFQTEKYFEHIREEVLMWFEKRLGEYKQMDGVVGVHVRRGDYVGNVNFPTVSQEYYDEAIAYFRNKGNERFLIVSDDVTWCRKSGWFGGCEFSEIADSHDDMSQYRNCEHHIIANSSFSWWGAWLNRNPNQEVISPSSRNWFGKHVKLTTTDVIPDRWIQIRY